MHRLPVRQIMTPDPITIGPDRLVADAADLMEKHGVRHLPVLDEDEWLIGIVTDSDIRDAETAGSVLSSYEPEADPRWLTVSDIMTPDVVTIHPDATVGQLAVTLIENKIGGVAVVEPDARYPKRLHLVGIVTETDIFTMIADAWQAESERAS
jgi:acetoin utilization protein AcuB